MKKSDYIEFFDKHNQCIKGREYDYIILIPLHVAIHIHECGEWERWCRYVAVSIPLAVSPTPPRPRPISHMVKPSFGKQRGTGKGRAQANKP